MRTARAFLLVLLGFVAAFGLPGCYHLEQVINVRPDGSASVVITIKVEKAGREVILANAKGKQLSDEEILDKIFPKAQVDTKIARFGEGTKLASFESFKDGETIGRRVTFSVPDVTQIKSNFGLGPFAKNEGKPVHRFEFKKGTPAILTVTMEPLYNPATAPPEEIEARVKSMAPMVKDLRMIKVVNVEGTLLKTDADLRDGNRITTAEFHWGELAADAKRVQAVVGAKTWDDFSKVVNAIPGNKVNSKAKIEIQFQ